MVVIYIKDDFGQRWLADAVDNVSIMMMKSGARRGHT
jgi:hypothetical protein